MTLYETDFVDWTRQQAALLRSMPSVDGLDIDHLVDEIEGLGRSAVADLSTAIRQVLEGLVLRSIDPSSVSIEDVYSAQSEAIIRSDAGVHRHVDLDKIWRLVARSRPEGLLPAQCPLSLDRLLAEDFNVAEAVESIPALTLKT